MYICIYFWNILLPQVNQRYYFINVFYIYITNFIFIKPCNYITITKYDLYNIHTAPDGCTHISFPSYGTKTWGACRIIHSCKTKERRSYVCLYLNTTGASVLTRPALYPILSRRIINKHKFFIYTLLLTK